MVRLSLRDNSNDQHNRFWASAPKGRCPVEHRGEFPYVRPSVRPPLARTGGSEARILGSQVRILGSRPSKGPLRASKGLLRASKGLLRASWDIYRAFRART